MDLLSMLQNAKIRDKDGFEIGIVVSVNITGGKLTLIVDPEFDDEIDPDDGEEEDIPALKLVSLIKAGTGGEK